MLTRPGTPKPLDASVQHEGRNDTAVAKGWQL